MLKPSLQLRLSQQLTMTPQLQQAIRLLQLPIMDLRTEIQQALAENVMLETEETTASETESLPSADQHDFRFPVLFICSDDCVLVFDYDDFVFIHIFAVSPFHARQ